MKDKTCCFTGHRKLPTDELEKTVIGLIADGYRFFGTGGALGFDTVAAQTVIRLKDKYPKIRLILVLSAPTKQNFGTKMTAENTSVSRSWRIRRYMLPKNITTVVWQKNRHLVDNSSVCVAYLTQSGGGTAYTVEYANKHGLKIINIAKNI